MLIAVNSRQPKQKEAADDQAAEGGRGCLQPSEQPRAVCRSCPEATASEQERPVVWPGKNGSITTASVYKGNDAKLQDLFIFQYFLARWFILDSARDFEL